jgi:hypothetical protein
MIVDASDDCNVANFHLGATADTREWNIKVTQYACGDENGGPDGCLQYFTGVSGTISSFNFPTSSSKIIATTTHLSSQCYTICIRQEQGKCSICYTTAHSALTGHSPSNQASFGLSAMQGTPTTHDQQCSTDFISIPNAEGHPATGTVAGVQRICGKFFTVGATVNLGVSVCSKVVPFRIMFKTDANEATGNMANDGNVNEQAGTPGGIVGFSLNYVEQDC